MTTPALSCAAALVDELIRQGVSDFVVSPGSRSAPLALVLADRERQGLVRMFVRVDERSAAFLAVGLARRSGDPVAIVCTSGTAAANLHPAVLEASYAPAPLVVLTADRPLDARNRGAAQTVDQVGMFGSAVRWSVDLAAPTAGDEAECDAWSAAGRRGAEAARSDPGPVHINAGFQPPLVGHVPAFGETESAAITDADTTNADVAPSSVAPASEAPASWPGAFPERGLLVVGDLPVASARVRHWILELADTLDWPVIAEPTAGPLEHPNVLRHGPLVLAAADFASAHVPELVITVGRFGLTRSVLGTVSAARDHWAVNLNPLRDPPDPVRSASAVLPGIPADPVVQADRGAADDWITRWLVADAIAAGVVESEWPDHADAPLTGPVAAIEARRSVGPHGMLFVGPSWPIRFLEADTAPRPGVTMANRGVNGIDGVVSAAAGAALAHRRTGGGPAVAVIGDLTFLHDHNGLVWPDQEPEPDLTYVVLDNDGGGLFSQLEQGESDYAADFERLFGTPHRLDLVEVASAAGATGTRVHTVAELRAELASARTAAGRRVIVASVGGRREQGERLRERVAEVSRALARH